MSVELQKLRAELLREALLKGWVRPSDIQAPWNQQLPPQRVERWYKALYKAPSAPLPVGQRLVNHFMLGADPEFVFHDGLQRCDARAMGLKAGPAFGADNNGRLCELRPAPSRSCLSVLTSMWLAMRWMVLYAPSTLAYSWRSGGFFDGDGLGGHVHFGRKRERLREREVACLDRLTHLQFVAGIFDKEEGRLRVRQAQGAPVGQPYGALGDIRKQPHGYEYRTLPSWIDGPWLAYFNLVVAKLAVAQADLVAPLTEADAVLTTEQARAQLRMLLAYYAPLDDDARLAFAILNRRGWPQHNSGMDFKSAWGLYADGPLGRMATKTKPPSVWPEVVPPTAETEQELALSMFEDRVPEALPLEPTWMHQLPEDYVHCIGQVDTKLAPGLGELVMDLAMHKDCPLAFHNCGHHKPAFRFPVNLAKAIKKSDLLQKLREAQCTSDIATEAWNIHVNASKDYSLELLLRARDIIVDSGVFPLWHLKDVRISSYQDWQNRARSADKRPGPRVLLERSGP
jgi:hypothetical protein